MERKDEHGILGDDYMRNRYNVDGRLQFVHSSIRIDVGNDMNGTCEILHPALVSVINDISRPKNKI